jgi:hypothetical protein
MSLTHQHALLLQNGTLKLSIPTTGIHARLPKAHCESVTGERYVLKIANRADSLALLELQNRSR